ncbi:uncharacterized protein AruCF_1339 [Achromobacter ruhlandii]|nr:uncharacterized protein AruCF_1339 [Achromobacter ruhlandii]
MFPPGDPFIILAPPRAPGPISDPYRQARIYYWTARARLADSGQRRAAPAPARPDPP